MNRASFSSVPTERIAYRVTPTLRIGRLPFNPLTMSTRENWITSMEAKDMMNAHNNTDNACKRDRPACMYGIIKINLFRHAEYNIRMQYYEKENNVTYKYSIIIILKVKEEQTEIE
jgi:hypothetical protein